MEKFEMGMGRLGNGLTVWNRAVTESGDYKTVAHISGSGKITLYVKPGYIPTPDMDRLTRIAEIYHDQFMEQIESEIKYNPWRLYARIQECLTCEELVNLAGKHKGVRANIEALLPLYLERV